MAVIAGFAAATPHAAAFDLRGTWIGTISCRGRINGNRDTFVIKPSTLLVGNVPTLRLSADGVFYSGLEFPETTNPNRGEIALVRCDTSPVRSGGEFGGEFGRMRVGTKPDTGGGTIAGTTLRASALLAETLYTCRWSYRRVSTAEPVLDPSCP